MRRVVYRVAAEGLRPYHGRPGATRRYLAGRIWQKRAMLEKARQCALSGEIVTLLLMSPTHRRHKTAFTANGIWLQRGGLFGKSDRSMAAWRFWRFKTRAEREKHRVLAARGQ